MSVLYRAEPPELRLAREMGVMTLIYHRRSGVTHMVSDPVPQILDALDALGLSDAAAVANHLARSFDLSSEDGADVDAIVVARLEELAVLGLVTREAA